ncbi:MAG: YihY family inner membrane protein [Deltaproteobacteria bacterium]|nr:YihY family inner membrane protein [Deltaproteobacteria bacterium]
MSSAILGGLTFKELALKTWTAIRKHNCLGRAAELAFYFLLALFPLLIVLLNLISFIPAVQEIILFWLSRLMPPDATAIVETWVQNVFANRSGGLVSFGLLFSLWAAATGMGALIAALNSAYEVEEGRPFWKAQLVALGLIVALCLLVIGGAVLITFGDSWGPALANLVGYEKTIDRIWLVIRYLMGLAMLIIGMAIIYIFAPNVQQRWTWIAPGALFAVTTFILASYLFSLYIRYAPSYNATYGSLGAVVVLMLWLYLMGLIMYIGGEINSEIANAAGKRVVRKV